MCIPDYYSDGIIEAHERNGRPDLAAKHRRSIEEGHRLKEAYQGATMRGRGVSYLPNPKTAVITAIIALVAGIIFHLSYQND